jgi:hypothetical protein
LTAIAFVADSRHINKFVMPANLADLDAKARGCFFCGGSSNPSAPHPPPHFVRQFTLCSFASPGEKRLRDINFYLHLEQCFHDANEQYAPLDHNIPGSPTQRWIIGQNPSQETICGSAHGLNGRLSHQGTRWEQLASMRAAGVLEV